MSFTTPRSVASAMTLLALATAACGGADASPTALTSALRPGGVPAYAGGPTSRDVVPTGKLDISGDTAPPPRTRYRIENHNGASVSGTSFLYFIWYGDWATNVMDQIILSNFASTIGSSAYFNIVSLYPNAAGQAPSTAITYAGSANDAYSHGATISDADVEAIVAGQITGGGLPLDPHGIYVVMASPDIWESSGLDASYCAFHNSGIVNGTQFRYVFVANPARSPSRCGTPGTGPNGSWTGDAAASLLAAELFNVITDPFFTGWYDKLGLEGADKCAWTYGTTHPVNGGQANVRLGQFEFLLQQLWVPSKNGGACGLSQ